MSSSLKIIFDHFLGVFLAFFFSFSSKISNLFIFFYFFYFTRTIKIIIGHWVLTEESPRLTTMDDNNTLTVFAGYYTSGLFRLPGFLAV